MRKSLMLHVEHFFKGKDAPATVSIWQILPEHVEPNVVGDARRTEILVQAYLTTEGDPKAGRKLYAQCDGTNPEEQDYMVEQQIDDTVL